MGNELAPFNFEQVKKDLAEKMKMLMFLAVPEDKIEEAIKTEWEVFVNGTPDRVDGSGFYKSTIKGEKPRLQSMVAAHLSERVKKRVEIICRGLSDESIDDAILDRLEEIVDTVSRNAKDVFWAGIGNTIVQTMLNRIDFKTEACHKCSFVYNKMLLENCPNCGQYGR